MRSMHRFWLNANRSRQLYVLFLIPLIYIVLFKYVPMFGIQIAFKDFNAISGIWNSPWVGLKHFKRLFSTYQFQRILTNTLTISLYSLIASLPFPIMLAIGLQYTRKTGFKKLVQMVSYAPYFISTVVMCGIILQFLAPRTGLVNLIVMALGGESVDYMGKPELFPSIYVWSGIWQGTGYGAIIYLAALSGISPELHEAAIVDGACVAQRIWHIDLPGIAPTIIILLIMNVGQILNVGFEKAYLLQNTMNQRTSEIIDTYAYKLALSSSTPNFSFSTAVGLFKSGVGLFLIVTVNAIAKKVGDSSLW